MLAQNLEFLFRRGQINRRDRLLPGRLIRNAQILTLERASVDAAAADLFAELLPRLYRTPLFALDLVDLFDEALGNRVVQRGSVERKSFRILPRRLAAELRKLRIFRAVRAVCRYDFKLAAPCDARISHRVEGFLIFVQVHFVEQDVAAFAGECQRIARKRADSRPVPEPHHECRDPVLFVHNFDVVTFQTARHGVRLAAPHRDVIGDELFRSQGVAGADPLNKTAAVFFAQAFAHGPVARAVGNADPARFLVELERRFVVDPALLIRQKISHENLRFSS